MAGLPAKLVGQQKPLVSGLSDLSDLGLQATRRAGELVSGLFAETRKLVSGDSVVEIPSQQNAPSTPTTIDLEPLPEDPYQRVAIAVFSRDDANAARYDASQTDTLLDPEIAIIEYPPKDGDAVALRLRNSGVLRPGELLVQSPFDSDVYAPVGDAAEVFARDKYAVFLEVCQTLGATYAKVTRVDARTASGSASAEFGGGNGVVTGEASVAREAVEEFTGKLNWERKFGGGEIDVARAEQILRDHQLAGDRPLRSLVRARGNAANPLLEDTLTVDLTSETQTKLDVAARVKPPTGGFEAKWSSAKRERVTVEVTLHVSFEP